MSDDMVLVEHEDAPDLIAEQSQTNPNNTTRTTTAAKGTATNESSSATAPGANKPSAEASSSNTASNKQTATPEISESAGVATEEGGKTATPEPLQIVSVGSEADEFAFTFHEDKLNRIMSRIPPGWKVAVVTVVGAFRTGKSFLLSWFLTYLHMLTHPDEVKSDKPWYKQVESLGNDGFHWRGGSERNTTGIWMWSQPHFVKRTLPDGTKETIAVLLVDSQGMFDNETTMSLTSSIFGMSTLLSSYQIYNVDKLIQEDNLQQLALFSEYARMALDAVPNPEEGAKPFQRMEFLVRDWQHFEDEDGDLDLMEKEMSEYLDKVIADRSAQDLQETREQILGCYKKLACFGLCHPGMQVVKKKYAGDVSVIEEEFLQLLDRFCQRVFHVDNLEPKQIQGRDVTAAELGAYIKAYAEMFQSGAKFPEAATMLQATATANNTNAIQLALGVYKDTMNRIAGPKCSNYIRPKELRDDHWQLVKEALGRFDEIANFGSKRAIEEARDHVRSQIEEEFEMYESLNTGRNPLAGFATYGIPIVVALIAFILRAVAESTCSPYSTVCKRGSDFFAHLYAVVLIFLVIVTVTKAKQVKDLFHRLRAGFELVAEGGKVKKD
mmetsp:Transcript_25291/g.70837  ORF Transcript_25291/g.70837 Transcript_25291/m.70837 type:complete len:610 (+) Transcript_25291:119-1948(+)|eukprot:CAMPEP_0119551962 /NCGR_PEP_ID=MMETSP1352-20130426/5079_1 /TAXON_ID=265584 /ORGANISM="Stauroneis constricta, Strain CCMP1120" /LENGTH=609 /DNA_ID=CAMNT_0007598105 /DNA_START=72 /DNA_END=1901 /DNA_ORIENTATION=+